MRAVAARDAGRSLAEAKEEIMDLAPKLRTYFLVDDLYHLMRGGRLSKSAAIMGSLASIKPILWIDAEGKLVPISKVRGRKKCCPGITGADQSRYRHKHSLGLLYQRSRGSRSTEARNACA